VMYGITGTQIAVLVGVAVGCLLVCGLLRRPWGWHVGTALQVAVILTGFYLATMFVLGGFFLLIWLYLLRLRTTVALPARFDH
jgi:high-affinity nickel permease